MPTPGTNETEDAFVERCIPIVIEDGTARDGPQAEAICHSMFEQGRKALEDNGRATEDTDGGLRACHAAPDATRQARSTTSDNGQPRDTVAIRETNPRPERASSEVPMDEKQAIPALMERPLGGATSFAELAQYEDARQAEADLSALTAKFGGLVENILASGIENKGAAVRSLADEYAALMDETKERRESVLERVKGLLTKAAPRKTEDGVAYPAADYAYVPDPQKPSTWKLRLTEGKPGNVTVRQLGRAAAALSSGGFRGQRVQLPGDDVARVKRRIRAAYRKLGVGEGDMPESVKAMSPVPFAVWKDKATGRWRWLAIYSNKFRDRDHPPEILAERAHKDFVRAVDAGEWEMPEMWLWHMPQLKAGTADFLAYDDRGFVVSCGLFDESWEDVAERLAKEVGVGTSHGMPVAEIERDAEDPTVITRYRTVEISPLPAKAAANELTGFVTFGGNQTMQMDKEKEGWLERVAGAERLAELDADIDDKAAKAAELELEHKEADAEAEADAAPVAEPPTEVEPEPEPEPQYVTADEGMALAGAIRELSEVIQNMKAEVGEVKALITELKESDAQKIAKTVEQTPAASIMDVLMGAKSVIGSPQAQVDGRTSLAKAQPKERKTDAAGPSFVPLLNRLATGDWGDDMDINGLLGVEPYEGYVR